jgi:hypothetical protein
MVVVAGSRSDSNNAQTPAKGTRHEQRLRAAERLNIDLATVEVIRALQEQGVMPVLLKGPAVVTWLYESAERRSYVDVDLLVAPDQLLQTERVLDALGFEQLVDDRAIAAFAEPHSVTYRRVRDRAAVDLHWRIPGIGADPQRAWRHLGTRTEEVQVAGASVAGLGTPARALHIALHALQNGIKGEQSMVDLRRAIERVEDSIWQAAARLATELDAIAAFTAGLRLCPEGDRLADHLGLAVTIPTRLALWSQTPPPVTVRLHNLAATPGIAARARLLWTAVAPPPAYIRAIYPSARTGSLALVHAYLSRLRAAIRNAPRAVRTLCRVWMDTRSSRRAE